MPPTSVGLASTPWVTFACLTGGCTHRLTSDSETACGQHAAIVIDPLHNDLSLGPLWNLTETAIDGLVAAEVKHALASLDNRVVEVVALRLVWRCRDPATEKALTSAQTPEAMLMESLADFRASY